VRKIREMNVPKLKYQEYMNTKLPLGGSFRVDADWNTSTVTLRVVGGDDIQSRVPEDSDPRKTALARASRIYKRETRPLVREGAPQNKTVSVKE
jgi:hypothetical protein